MDKLFQLLHELIDHAVEQGNKRGELHALVDELAAGPAELPANPDAAAKP